jgi:signal transduction histidine kinase
VFIARSTQRLAARLRGHPTPEDLRLALAEEFDDPSLAIVYWLGNGDGHWGDADGHRRDPPAATPGRAVTEIVDGESPVAAIVHDAALADDRAFVDTATSYALMTLDNHRLSAQASSLLRAVRESRSRIQAAADDERRRIERDLHDGAQQRLVALRIKLELAAERTGDGHGNGAEGAAVLRRLGGDVEAALEEVRSLARGIYPAPLADRGLVEGLRAAALRNPLPTTVLAAGVRRHSRTIESAAYFCCLEALQNAAKHAEGASSAVVELSDNGSLRLEVRDDGAGFDPDEIASGVGFTSMRDRVAAVGGELAITSSPGRGTLVSATIPLRPDQR